MSATGDGPRTGGISRMLLKLFGPAQITPADDDDRLEQEGRPAQGDARPQDGGDRPT